MNSPIDLTFDKAAFLLWAERQEGRVELKGGHVVMMAGGSRGHARVMQEIAFALRRRLDPGQWSVSAADLAVEIGEDIRYPDVLVEAAGGDAPDRSTSTPVFVVEVLSPSSLALDLHIKAAEYMSLPSLEAYLVAAQDEPRVWLWQRPAGGGARPFPKKPEEASGAEAVVRLHALAVEMTLAEIYANAAPRR